MFSYKNLVIILMIGLFLGGCATPKLALPSMNKQNLDKKVSSLDEKVKEAEALDDLLRELELANIYRGAQDYNKSNHYFTLSEKYLKATDTENVVSKALISTMAVLVNDTIMDYDSRHYERVMVNTYKAMNSLFHGKDDEARVEFNRAMQRQRKAREYFANEIKEEKEKLAKKSEEERKKRSIENKTKAKKNKKQVANNGTINIDLYKTANSPKIREKVMAAYPSIAKLKAYPDFVNPFSTYMSALYSIKDKNYEKATRYLKIVTGIMPENKTVASDLLISDKAQGSISGMQKKYTWIVVEDGNSAQKEQFKLDLPLFLLTNKVYYTGVALPKLKTTADKAITYKINYGKNKYTLDKVADMDTVIKSEFKKRLPMIYTRAFISMGTKTLIQYEAGRKAGWMGQLAASVYQGLTNTADMRMWSSLPKTFRTTRIENNNLDKQISILSSNGWVKNVSIPVKSDKNAIVFISSVNSKKDPIIEKIYF